MNNYYEEEKEEIKKIFDLEEILQFQSEHKVEIIKGEDLQYICYIDNKGYGTALTTLGAVVIGIKQFKKK